MTAIDHVAEAKLWIRGVEAETELTGITEETMVASAGIAQAHATLALVEQQRIANLLAYAQFRWTDPDGPEQTLSIVFQSALAALLEAGRALGMEQSA